MQQTIKERINTYESKILASVGIKKKDYKIGDDDTHLIHYIELGDRTNQPLILIHGYGGSAVTFFKILPQLAQHFHVVAIDLLGFGNSQRPDFQFTTFEASILFFAIPIVSLINYLRL